MTAKQKGNVLLHPVRLRIVTELWTGKATPKQLVALLPDIPQATLYRQLKKLHEAGMIEVLEEHQVNGATERTYGVMQAEARFSPEELKSLTAEDHERYFSIFVGSLLEGVKRYTQGKSPEELGTEGLSYNRMVLHLNAEERQAFKMESDALMARFVREPSSDRKRYTLASVVIPDERDKK